MKQQGKTRLVINEYLPSGIKPTIIVTTADGKMLKYPLEPKTAIFVDEGTIVKQADTLAKTPKAIANLKISQEVFLELGELFEARRPKTLQLLQILMV